MRIRLYKTAFLLISTFLLLSCDDTDSFAPAGNRTLTFAEETVDLGVVFSGMPSATKDIWVYNSTGDGIVCSEIRLAQGNQTGFRVNVDGWYLGPTSGYRAQDVEIASGDSIRIFVELTSFATGREEPQELSDYLIFTLDGGTTQRLLLKATTLDAVEWENYDISSSVTVAEDRPVLVRKTITVAEGAVLTIAAGTTLYFANNAGIDVHGTLVCEGEAGNEVCLRGDRIDNMFDYLPYDRVAGQWQGVHFYPSSVGNRLTYTDIHSTYNGIVIDTPTNEGIHLTGEQLTVHNCQGYGILSQGANIQLVNTQVSNALESCLNLEGGGAYINGCTFAQFYPFDSQRGAAIRFSNYEADLYQMTCLNSIFTGYADDVVAGAVADNGKAFVYQFDHCLLRTEIPSNEHKDNFVDCIVEDITSEEEGSFHNFAVFDTENLIYDFSLATGSAAIGNAAPVTVPSIDRLGASRDEHPDMGAYEYIEANE